MTSRFAAAVLSAGFLMWSCGEADLSVGDTEELETGATTAEAALRAAPTYDKEFEAAGERFSIPPALLKSLSWAETRYELVQGEPDHEGQPARFGLMALWGDALTEGATLAGVTEEQAKLEAGPNVLAAAAYLDKLARARGIDRGDAEAWALVLEEYARLDDVPEAKTEFAREHVFGALKAGVGAPSERLRAATTARPFALPEQLLDVATAEQRLSAGPDYAPALWRPSPNFNSRSGVAPKMVIIHTCEGAYSGCWGWLTRTAAQASAHYVVSTGSEISQLVREGDRAWHIAATYKCTLNSNVDCFRNGTSSNNFTIGIEHAGFASQTSFPAAQLDASARLVCNITKDRGIVRDRFHIVGHGQLQPYNRTDPGRNWPWTSYLAKVNSFCGASQPPPTTPPPTTPPPSSGEIVVDSNNARNNQARGYIQVSGNWTSASSTSGFYGTGYFYAATAPVSDGASFWFKLDAPARKTIDAWWTAGTNRSSAAPFVAFNAGGAKVGSATMNQSVNGGAWRTVGTFDFSAGWNRIVLSRWAAEGKVVIADAVRIR